MRKIESFWTGSLLRTSFTPTALWCTTLPWRVSSVTTPASPLFVDRPLHRFVDAAQPLGRDANRFGRRDGEVADPGRRRDGAEFREAGDGSHGE